MLPSKPLSFFTIYDYAFQLWRNQFTHLFFVAFIVTLITTFSSQYTAAFISTLHTLLKNVNTHPIEQILIPFLNSFITIVCYAILLVKANQVATNHSPFSYIAFTWLILKKIPFLFLGMILAGVALSLGFILLFIPGVYIGGMLFLFYALIILEENSNPFKNFMHSFHLIYGHWWRIFFTIPIPFLFITLINIFIGKFFMIAVLPHLHLYFTLLSRFITQAIIMSFFSSWICIQTIVLLNDLKLRKPAFS